MILIPLIHMLGRLFILMAGIVCECAGVDSAANRRVYTFEWCKLLLKQLGKDICDGGNQIQCENGWIYVTFSVL